MTKFDSHALPVTSPRALATTIYRDIPQASRLQTQPAFSSLSGARVLVQQNEAASNGIFLGFAAMTMLTIVYSFAQLWSLLSGGALEQAVRAIVR